METMTTAEQPVTRSQLSEELDRLRDEFKSYYATKADLAQLEMRLTIRLTRCHDLRGRCHHRSVALLAIGSKRTLHNRCQ